MPSGRVIQLPSILMHASDMVEIVHGERLQCDVKIVEEGYNSGTQGFFAFPLAQAPVSIFQIPCANLRFATSSSVQSPGSHRLLHRPVYITSQSMISTEGRF